MRLLQEVNPWTQNSIPFNIPPFPLGFLGWMKFSDGLPPREWPRPCHVRFSESNLPPRPGWTTSGSWVKFDPQRHFPQLCQSYTRSLRSTVQGTWACGQENTPVNNLAPGDWQVGCPTGWAPVTIWSIGPKRFPTTEPIMSQLTPQWYCSLETG